MAQPSHKRLQGGAAGWASAWQRGAGHLGCRGHRRQPLLRCVFAVLVVTYMMPRNALSSMGTSTSFVQGGRQPASAWGISRCSGGAAAGGAAASPPALDCEEVVIEMPSPLDGRVGVSIQGGRRSVSRLTHKDAFDAGWRLGDVIVEVNDALTKDNEAVKQAVKEALASHAETGAALRFKVRRQAVPVDSTRGMVKMTPGTGGELTNSMADLLRSLMYDYKAVLYMDGTIRNPASNLSEKAVQILNAAGVAYRAVDAADEKFNPGVREALQELSGDFALPQLFVNGRPVGNGFKIQEMSESGELEPLLKDAGVPKFIK